MENAIYNEERERREASRMGREEACEFALLSTPQGTIRAEVLDESLGGLRLLLSNLATFALGDSLDIYYAGQTSRGTVCHLLFRTDGKLILGLDCGPRPR